MGQDDMGRYRRPGDFRSHVEGLLADADSTANGAGKIVCPIHQGRVQNVRIELSCKPDDPARDVPDGAWPLFGRSGLLASFREALQMLVSGSYLLFGEVAVFFANGLVTRVAVTANFQPGEDDRLGRFLGYDP